MLRQVAARSAIVVMALTGIVPGAISTASAAILAPDLYRMHNHPDAMGDPPPYGLRLDELVDVDPNEHDIFSWDLDFNGGTGGFSSVALLSIRELPNFPGRYRIDMAGEVFGGLNDGDSYSSDTTYVGEWTFEFSYIVGVQTAFADDDFVVNPDEPSLHENGGWIKGPGPAGQTYLLEDDKAGEYSFRLGDENNDQGHRGFDGISGWGWLKHGLADPLQDVPLSDWLVTIETTPFPSPGSLALFSVGAVCVLQRRRIKR